MMSMSATQRKSSDESEIEGTSAHFVDPKILSLDPVVDLCL